MASSGERGSERSAREIRALGCGNSGIPIGGSKPSAAPREPTSDARERVEGDRPGGDVARWSPRPESAVDLRVQNRCRTRPNVAAGPVAWPAPQRAPTPRAICRVETRSRPARNWACQSGSARVLRLPPGISRWRERSYPELPTALRIFPFGRHSRRRSPRRRQRRCHGTAPPRTRGRQARDAARRRIWASVSWRRIVTIRNKDRKSTCIRQASSDAIQGDNPHSARVDNLTALGGAATHLPEPKDSVGGSNFGK